MMLATILGYLSGLQLVASHLDAATLTGTALVVLVCDGIMCRLIAHNTGYPKTLWTILGLIGGLWAVAVLILLPRRAVTPASPGKLP